MAELYDQIQQNYRDLYASDEMLSVLSRKILQGKATQQDMAQYAQRTGELRSQALKSMLKLEDLPDGMTEEVADETMRPALEEEWQDVNAKAALQLRGEDRKADRNIGIKTGFGPRRRIDDVVSMAVGQTTQEALDNALTDPVISLARKYYDDFMAENADLRSRLGFKEVVIRKYDDKGLHGGKDRCQWCLAREGTWSLEEAHANGVFERHPGCGCLIEVITPAKTQVQTDWTRNAWTNI